MESNSAKESLKALLATLGIKRVVCVDDEYLPFDESNLIGLAATQLDLCKGIGEMIGKVDFDKPEPVWNAQLKKFWQEATSETKKLITSKLENETVAEFTSISPLNDLFDGTCELLIKTPDEWDADKETLLTEAKAAPTLFLFDKDLTKAGLGDEGGVTLLRTAIQEPHAICGMLSHHFSFEDEQPTWLKYVGDGLPGERFILISKKHLQGEHQLGFVRMVKLTILNAPCKELVELLVQRMKDSIDSASGNVAAISVFDFEDIVFRKSLDEGIWEADTLFRILSLYQRKVLVSDAAKNEPIHAAVGKIRTVLSVRTHEDFSSKDISWKIQRLEWYQEANELNSHFVPIGLGDIFQKTTGGKKFLLLCQPCDIMVRKNGARNYQLADVFMAEITDKYNEANAFTKAKFFNPENGKKPHYVNFQCRFAVSLDVIDLCALNETGEATYKLNSMKKDLLIPSWVLRSDKLSALYDPVIASLLNPPMQTKKDWEQKMPKATRDGQFLKPTFNQKDTISYPLKRIGRLSSPYSNEILSAFCAYLSRPAHAMEFTADNQIMDEQCLEEVGSSKE